MIGRDLMIEAAIRSPHADHVEVAGVEGEELINVACGIVGNELAGKESPEVLMTAAASWCAGFMAGVYAARVEPAS